VRGAAAPSPPNSQAPRDAANGGEDAAAWRCARRGTVRSYPIYGTRPLWRRRANINGLGVIAWPHDERGQAARRRTPKERE